MFKETLEAMGTASINKVKLLRSSVGKYLVASMWAGFFVGIGIVLIMVVGSSAAAANSTYTKVFMGLAFGIALSLVIMVGSELFTGNNMIMVAGALDKKVTWKDAGAIWLYSYIGNFIGSFLVGGLFVYTGIAGSPVAEFIVKASEGKMNGNFMDLMVKGILCNLLVCLAVLCALKLKSESAKLIMIFWCLFAFIASGFEHSVANMTIFTMGLLLPHPETVSIMGMFQNLLPVTLGNFIGGGLMLGASYYYLGKEKEV